MATWEPYSADVTAAFRGVTVPARELYDEIHGRGWDVTKVDVRDGQYVATVKNPYGQEIEKTGPTAETALSNALLALTRIETMRYQGRTAAWQTSWSENLPEIAQAYADAPIYDPKAAGAWKELADDCTARANQIAQQVQVEFTHDPHPYKDVNEMVEDLTKNKHILITTANADHPLWSLDQVLAYRLVHDVLGHAQAGGDWGWHGENRATAAHMPLLSPSAQKALFTEAIGQTAHNNFYRTFGPTKVTFLDDHLKDAQDAENAPGHAGVHPSQTTVPGLLPEIPSVHEASAEDLRDPNHGWESGVNPLQDNAYLWQREVSGLDPLDHQGVKDAAHKINTGWFNFARADGSPDLDSQKQAVVNAFRAVLESPRKPYRWNAAHYQAIQAIPANVDDPLRYHDAIEHQRDAYNQARGLPAGISHQLYNVEANSLRSWVKAQNPQLDDAQAADIAKRELFHMMAEEEERITSEDAESKLTTAQIAAETAQALKKRLAVMLKGKVDQKFDFGRNRLFHEAAEPVIYGDHLVSHLRPVAGVSHYADALLKAAREDVAQHGGKGHHFRASAMHLIPGVGPRELSYAWMLLQPHTSELAVIDPTLAQNALDHKGSDIPNRDYFKLERQLAAGRDAAGYSHVPLGQFGWGLHDNIAYGHAVHRDHLPLRPVDPAPYEQIDWDRLPGPSATGWSNPYWWASTQPARDQVGRHYDEAIGVNNPRDEIPYKSAAEEGLRTPYFIYQGVPYEGQPGHSVMQHARDTLGLSTEEIWKLIEEAEKR